MKIQNHKAFEDKANQMAIIRLILDAVKNRVKTAEQLYQSALALLYAGWTTCASVRDFEGRKLNGYSVILDADEACMFCSSGAIGAIGYVVFQEAVSGVSLDTMCDMRDEVSHALQDELIARFQRHAHVWRGRAVVAGCRRA